jgi:hypothetical protein
MRNIKIALILSSLLVTLSGCMSGATRLLPAAAPPAPPPPMVQASSQSSSNVPTLEIFAPVKVVRDAIISRAKARGTTVGSVDPSGIVLEKVLQQSPPALESSCGPHKKGRRIRVLLGTADQGAVTLVSEQRFVVDDGAECQIKLTPDVVEDAKRSLNELKTESESKVARR